MFCLRAAARIHTTTHIRKMFTPPPPPPPRTPYDSDAPFLSAISGWRSVFPVALIGWGLFFGVQAVMTGQRTLKASPVTRGAVATLLSSPDATAALGGDDVGNHAVLGRWFWGETKGRATRSEFRLYGVGQESTPVARIEARAVVEGAERPDIFPAIEFIKLVVCIDNPADGSGWGEGECRSLVDLANAKFAPASPPSTASPSSTT